MTSDHLFVYGTLMRGFDNPTAQLLSRRADFIGEARCQGRLYLAKDYPALVLSDDAGEVVFGELFRLREPSELLREFDAYEADVAGPTEYVRQMVQVTCDQAAQQTWSYLYNLPVTGLPRIASGRFLDSDMKLRPIPL
jgi:gamma-glutamylcyclotransferase (GGCT)/AIG2-like uncharacterized protein YtfP